MFKRVIASALVIVMMLTVSPVMASASKKTKEDAKTTGVLKKTNVKLEAGINKAEFKSVSAAGVEARKGFYNHKSKVTVKVKSKNTEPQSLFDKLEDAIFAETNNSSEGDFMRWDVDETETSYSAKKSGSYYYYVFTINVKYLSTITQRNALDKKISSVIKGFNFTNKTSEYNKVKKIYDYVAKNVKYQDSDSVAMYSAYNAMIKKKAVCQGYATLLYKMLRTVGISTRVVAGNSSFSGQKHGWNIVKIGNYYYNTDVTWDSTLEHAGKKYKYFLKGDSFKGHQRWTKYNSYSFYNQYPMAAKAYNANTTAKASTATKIAKFKHKKPKIQAINRSKVVIKKVSGAKYQVKYSSNKKFKKATSVTAKTKKRKYKFKKLKKGWYYFVKVRAYKKIKGKTYYTKWSKVSII